VEHYYALIMAGGGGTRLWPMSRQDTPKQLLPLVEESSMFKVSVDRLAPLFAPDQIYVVTGRKYKDSLRAHAPQIPEENFIIEPYGKESGPAAALGLTVIQKRDPEATVAILTADHHITKKDAFPSTGFGYIQQGEVITSVDQFTCYHSLGFTEKPNAVTAATFLASGEYTWNSGMFIWTVKQAMSEFERQQEKMYHQLMQIAPSVDTPEYDTRLEDAWEHIEKISLDYAVMEGAEKMAVIPVDIGWNDVGSWSSMYDVLKLDKYGNAIKGRQSERVILDTRDTLVYSDKLVVTIGVEDLIVIETPDALLLCHKDRSQDVKEVVNHLLRTRNYKFL
jgi:mannose-1-phosphate guanylyltransferase